MKHLKKCLICKVWLEEDTSGSGNTFYCFNGCYEIAPDILNQFELIEIFKLNTNDRVVFSAHITDERYSIYESYSGGISVETTPGGDWRDVGKIYTKRPSGPQIRKIIQQVINSKMMILQ